MHIFLPFLPLIAALLLFVSFIPFILKIIRNKTAAGASSTMLMFGFLQSISYVIYDIYFARYAMGMVFGILGTMFIISYCLVLIYGNKSNG